MTSESLRGNSGNKAFLSKSAASNEQEQQELKLQNLTKQICTEFLEKNQEADIKQQAKLREFCKNLILANMIYISNEMEYNKVNQEIGKEATQKLNFGKKIDIEREILAELEPLIADIGDTKGLGYKKHDLTNDIKKYIDGSLDDKAEILGTKLKVINKFIEQNKGSSLYDNLNELTAQICKHVYSHRLKFLFGATAIVLAVSIICPATAVILTPALTASLGSLLLSTGKEIFNEIGKNNKKEEGQENTKENNVLGFPIERLENIWKNTKEYIDGQPGCKEASIEKNI